MRNVNNIGKEEWLKYFKKLLGEEKGELQHRGER